MEINKEKIQKIFSNFEFVEKVMDDQIPPAQCKKYFTAEGVDISDEELDELKYIMEKVDKLQPKELEDYEIQSVSGGGTSDAVFIAAMGTQIAAMTAAGLGSILSTHASDSTTDQTKEYKYGALANKLLFAMIALAGTTMITGEAFATTKLVQSALHPPKKTSKIK